MEIPGLIVPPLTPFTSDLRVDYAALEREIDYIVVTCKASAVEAAAVETQEYHYLSPRARKDLIRRTVQCVGGRCPVIVGISHPSFRTAVELAHLAEDLGAEAIQVLAPLRPFGGPPGLKDLIGYFEAIAQKTQLPIVAYLNPGPGAEVPLGWTVELARLDRVRYFKESSRDLRRVSRLIVEIDRAGHAHYFTTMEMLLISLLLGGSGATMPPPGAKIAFEVLQAFRSGDLKRAAEIQRQFALFPALWVHKGLAPVMKAAMRIVGLEVGDPYPPFQSLDAGERALLEDYLKTTCLFA
jgi:4-hydroxy-tetrahydrodipicolinate synthase